MIKPTKIMYKLPGINSNRNLIFCSCFINLGTNSNCSNIIAYTTPVVYIYRSILNLPSVMLFQVPVCTASVNRIRAGMHKNLINFNFILLMPGVVVLHNFLDFIKIHDVELSVVDTPCFRCGKRRRRHQSDDQAEHQQNC